MSDSANKAVAQSDEAKRRMASLAHFARQSTHDIGNLLTVVRTYSELLLSELPSDHAIRADLTEIANASDATVAYLQRASAFARAATARLASVDLDGLVRAALTGGDAAQFGLLSVHTESHVTVRGSESALTDALHELVKNAREASPEAGQILVATHAETVPESVERHGVVLTRGIWGSVTVRDQGAGVPSELGASVFDPLVTTKRAVRGAGIGLALAQSAAWAAGGAISLVRDDGWTLATLYLPAAV